MRQADMTKQSTVQDIKKWSPSIEQSAQVVDDLVATTAYGNQICARLQAQHEQQHCNQHQQQPKQLLLT